MFDDTRDISGAGSAGLVSLVRGDNHLFAVAIDRYVHQRTLASCVRDAEDLIRILITSYAFKSSDVATLFNDAATKKQIFAQLEGYASTLSDADSLVIYYAGHGVVRNDIGYWIPVDAADFTEFLPLSWVRDFIENIKARHVFIVVDACFAGRFFADTRGNATIDYIEAHPSRYALTSGREERVIDGLAGGNSPFAESLKYHLASTHHAIGAVALSDLVMRDVVEKVQGFQTPRHGELNIHGNHHGQFFFHPRSAAESARDAFVSTYFARGGVLVPPPQRAHRLAHFDRYDQYFQAADEAEQTELRRMNTCAYLQVVGLDIRTLKESLAKLGYYKDAIDQIYNENLAAGLRDLQADQMMRQIDGYFGELTFRQMVTMLVERGLASMPRSVATPYRDTRIDQQDEQQGEPGSGSAEGFDAKLQAIHRLANHDFE